MSARPESSFRRAEASRAGLAFTLGLVLLTASWGILHVGFYDRSQIVDTPVYQDYGDATLGGEVPYRDFAVDYPPGALPVFVLPSLAAAEDYEEVFDLLMWTCAVATLFFLVLTLAAAGAETERLLVAAAFAGLAPLALGSVILSRYDLWPAALVSAALAALVAGRERIGFAALGLAAAAKGYPVVLLPLALVWVGRRRGAREAWVGLAAFAATAAAVVIPFALLAPKGLASTLARQIERPLQIESLGSSLLLAADQAGLYTANVVSSFGSQNLGGSLPDVLAALLTVLQVAALVAVWIVFARHGRGVESFLAASAASLAAFVAFGKVLSPQFMIWLLPLVPLVAGRLGLAASGVLAAALVTTQLWFPFRYWDVVALRPVGWFLLVRDLLLVALFALLLAASIRRTREGPRTA